MANTTKKPTQGLEFSVGCYFIHTNVCECILFKGWEWFQSKCIAAQSALH